MKPNFIVLLLIILPILVFAQGPISGFMPQKGQWDIATTYSQEDYSEFYNGEGETEQRALTQKSYNFYLEHGFDEKTSLVITAPYIEHDDENKGLQDASIWVKYRNDRIKKESGTVNFITSFGLSVPLSKYATDNPAAIGNRASTVHGRFLMQFDANYGWFFQVQSGLDFQFSPDAVAAFPLLLKGGIGTKWFYFDLWFEHFQALNAQNDQQTVGTGSTWNKLGTTLYVPIKPWLGAFVGGATVLSGKNIGAGSRLNLGLVFRILP